MSRRATRFCVLSSASLAVAVLLTGCTSAAHSARTSTAAPITNTTPVVPPGPRAVHLSDYSNNDSADSSVILTGAIGDYGHAVSVHANGSTDPEHGDQLNLVLAHGSFRLSIADIDKHIVAAFTTFPPNTTTCSGLVSEDGAAPIVPGSGTGAYQNLHGTFELHVSIDEVDRKSHCNAGSKFLSQTIVITGWAQVTQ